MRQNLLARVAARARRSMGVTEIVQRLEALERRVESADQPHYPRGPVYFGDHTVLLATRWGAKMLVETRDAAIAPWLALNGMWEKHVTVWMQETLRPGDVFVDVGANVGYFTLLAATLVGPGGKVVAVEAHPRLAEILHRNVVINGCFGYVTTWNKAAWSSTTSLSFHLRKNFAGNSSAGSIGEADLLRLGDTEETVTVDAVTLDELLADLPKVSVVKIDVEGAEVHAFTGMEQTMAANPDLVVMFEWAPAQIEAVGDTPSKLAALVDGHGFKLRLLETGQVVEPDELLQVPYGNVVAQR